MLQALLAGVSSIQSQQSRLTVIGNDLSNVNTDGFKSSDVLFKSMLSQTLEGAAPPQNNMGGTNPVQVGLGAIVGSTTIDQAQGSLNATGQPTDMAIQGNGFFMVSTGNGVSYTRDGAFSLDANGDVVQSSTGYKLLGWSANNLGQVSTATGISASSNLNIPLGSLSSVQPTTNLSLSGNLNSNALSTDTWTSQATVYDSLGGAQTITIQYSNHASPPPAAPAPPAGAQSSWDWAVYAGTSTAGAPLATSAGAGNSPLFFDADGNIIAPGAGVSNTVAVPGGAGSNPAQVKLDFSTVSQVSSNSNVSEKSQNGFPPGSLSSFNIGQDGTITGTFTNGLTRPLGQVALATFANPEGLSATGSNQWQATANSGLAQVAAPGQNGAGVVSAGFLEQSNVDMGTEFSNLIVTQAGFQANTKIVSTVDQMLQTLIAMKQ